MQMQKNEAYDVLYVYVALYDWLSSLSSPPSPPLVTVSFHLSPGLIFVPMHIANVLCKALTPPARRVITEPELPLVHVAFVCARAAHVRRVPRTVLRPASPLADALLPIRPLLPPARPP